MGKQLLTYRPHRQSQAVQEDCLTPKTKAVCSFQMSVTTYPVTAYNIPEDLNLEQYRYTNAKSCTDRA